MASVLDRISAAKAAAEQDDKKNTGRVGQVPAANQNMPTMQERLANAKVAAERTDRGTPVPSRNQTALAGGGKKSDFDRVVSGAKSIGMSLAATLPLVAETAAAAAKGFSADMGSDAYREKLTEVNGLSGMLEGLGEGDPQYAKYKAKYDTALAELNALKSRVSVDADSTGMSMMREAARHREEATEGMSGVGKFLADTAIGIGQNVALLPTAAINPAIPLVAMGAQSGAQKMYEVQAGGGSAGEALGRGIVAGGVEAITEKIPLDTLLDVAKHGGKSALKNVLQQAGIEAGEETVSYLANLAADKVAGDENAQFSGRDLALSALGGAISGGVLSGGATAVNRVASGRAAAQTADGQQKTASTKEAGEYRAEKPQNVELPTVPIINLSMKDVAGMNNGVLPQTGAALRKDAIARARTRLKLDENSAAYIPASNVTRNGDEYVLKVTKASLNKMFNPSDGSDVPVETVAIMDNLERIANNGVYFQSEGDRKGRDQINGVDHLLTTVYIDNVPTAVDMRVRLVQQEKGSSTDNVLYYFTPETITLKRENGAAPAAERRAFRGEASPSSEFTVPQEGQGVKTQEPGNSGLASPQVPDSGTTAQTSPVDALPAKARNFLSRSEGAFARKLGEAMGVPQNARQQLKAVVQKVSAEYLAHGDVSQQASDALFEQAWTEFSGTDPRNAEDPAFKKWAKMAFEEALEEMKPDLEEVERYVADRAARASAKVVRSMEDVKALYPQMKDARRTYEKVLSQNLLTADDEVKVGQLLRGDIGLEHLNPARNNVRAIEAVYRAKLEYEKLAKQIRDWNQRRKGELRAAADGLLETANMWKDKKHGIQYSRETMERNVRDIVPDKELADRVIDAYFTPVHKAVAEATKTKNAYRDRVKAMNLSRKVAPGNQVSEAHAVQLLGEAEDNIRMIERSRGQIKMRDGKTLEDWNGILLDLRKENPNLDWDKVTRSVEAFRSIYDELFTRMNETRMRNGYEPVNYRSGYFPHFQPGDGDGLLAQFGKALGIDTAVTALPTSINGLTHTFKPGIQWFGSAQERLGFNTVYDAVEGFDRYIEGVSDVIHLTDSIQNLRALATQTRYRTTDQGIRDQVDAVRADSRLTEDEKKLKIDEIYEKGRFSLSNFVVELEEYTNLLANKKSRADRNMEQALGRDAYNLMKGLESRVAANMVAVNPGSWLTNFIPITQGWGSVGSKHLLRGMMDSLKAIKVDDGFTGQSTFLTNRQGSDPLVRTWAQGWSDKLSQPMTWIDSFTSNSLVRSRYAQNIEAGMSEAAAMDEADSWAASIMADRSKGSTPTLFNRTNPLTKAFTQFQLEVNNQLSYLFKDLPADMKEKGKAAMAAALIKFFVGAFLYNEVYEYIVGRRPALDPIGILNDTAGDLTGYELPNLVELGVSAATGKELPGFRTEKTTPGEAVVNLGGNVVAELPFTAGLSLLGMETDAGRIPIASALPDVPTLLTAAGNTDWAPEKRMKEVTDELAKPLTYLALPFGGGQAKKVLQGAKAVMEGGSYSMDSQGRDLLQYPVYGDTPAQAAESLTRSVLFGKSSLPEGREWVESGFKTLGYKETALYQNMLEAGMSGEDAYGMIQAIRAASGKDAKLDVIAGVDLSESAAKDFFGLVLGTDLETEAGNPTQYAKMLDALDTSLTAQEVVALRKAGSSGLDKFLSLNESGIDAEAAYKVSMAMMRLKPAAGEKSVSNLQQYRAVLSAGLSDSDQMTVLETLMGESEYRRLQAGNTLGVLPDTYVSCKELLPKFDADGNGSYKHTEVTAAIRSMRDLTVPQRAVLWQIVTGSTSAKNNPFSSAEGQKACNLFSR